MTLRQNGRSGRRACCALMTLALCSSYGAAANAGDLGAQRKQVEGIEAKIAGFQTDLEHFTRQYSKLDGDLEQTGAELATAHLQLERAQQQRLHAEEGLKRRAREAYKGGGVRQLEMLLSLRSFSDFVSYSPLLERALAGDTQAIKRLQGARDEVLARRTEIESRKARLLGDGRRMDSLRTLITRSLVQQQAAFQGAQAELIRMQQEAERAEAERIARTSAAPSAGRAGTPSPEVEARRSAQQQKLDARLQQLFTWVGNVGGDESFTPETLKRSSIIFSGPASWYGPGFDGRRASSGATYRQEWYTAASLTLPFGTWLRISYRGKTVVVIITDRGPYIAGRILDLSQAAAQFISLTGVAPVVAEILLPASPQPVPFP